MTSADIFALSATAGAVACHVFIIVQNMRWTKNNKEWSKFNTEWSERNIKTSKDLAVEFANLERRAFKGKVQ
jgi:signal-transduction protein with cAMP-binding, CBS, and nucleotidyltransferase domain